MTRIINNLFIYPVKSLHGVGLNASVVTPLGLQFDRRYMLVDADGKFLTQREIPVLALFRMKYMETCFEVSSGTEMIEIPLKVDQRNGESKVNVEVWSDKLNAFVMPEDVNVFFSEKLKQDVRLVYMNEIHSRPVDGTYNRGNDFTSFSDGFPILMIGTASLDELNRRLRDNGYSETLGWDRFRPNIVVETEEPFEEDHWQSFSVGGIDFEVAKPCARCVITTTNQRTAERNAEPLRTLAQFRKVDQKVMFGQNILVGNQTGMIGVQDRVEVTFR